MQILLMALIALHALAGVFWAGSTLTLTHLPAANRPGRELFKAQMGAAVIAIGAGLALWGIAIRGDHGPMATTLGVGALCAVIAAGVQGALRKSPVTSQRIAAVLLSITVICMVIAPYVT